MVMVAQIIVIRGINREARQFFRMQLDGISQSTYPAKKIEMPQLNVLAPEICKVLEIRGFHVQGYVHAGYFGITYNKTD